MSDTDLSAFAAEHGIAALLDHLGLDEYGNEIVALRAALNQAEKALESGRGPDDPADCPAGHGDQCCGWREACLRALAVEAEDR